MDNDDKISKKKDATQLFLKDTTKYLRVKPEDLYNLEEEFDKTKKNKNILFKLIFLAFISGIVVITIAISTYLDNRYKNMDINIEDFQDLNLKELLDTARKNENELQGAEDDLEEAKKEHSESILAIRTQVRKKINDVNAETLLKAVQDTKIREIRKDEAARIASVNRKYNALINEKEGKIKAIKEKISTYDKEQIEKAKKNEQILDNQKRLYDMETQNIINAYENKLKNTRIYYNRRIRELVLRYNPIFSDKEIKAIVESPLKIKDETVDLKKTDFVFPILYEWDKELSKENVASKEGFDDLRNKIVARNIIIKQLSTIPYENSIPPALEHLDFYDRYIINSYEQMWNLLVEKLNERNITLQQFLDAFQKTMIEGAENGYIIDATNKENVIIVSSKFYKIKEGDIGTIFRGKNDLFGEKVAILTFSMDEESGKMKAKITEEKVGKIIRPFDKIKIKRGSGEEGEIYDETSDATTDNTSDSEQ